ncbi:hypothetical protein WR25_06196 [Diploscapter pachys]|uniref:Protein kinase domain-containing protein n=1 Tax=Diploscapter pachys TaxID=2018661 RepID=A0A2A2KWL1_9BILA|nr:hypothetical protein WR25_06196 [Diploscapter pachys]
MITTDREDLKKYPRDANHQVDGPKASKLPKFEVQFQVEKCKETVAIKLPYYQKDKEMIYKNFSTPRGLVLIINNKEFDQLETRYGTEVDEKKLKNLFEQFGYKVQILNDRTAKEMMEDAKEFAKNIGHKNAQSCIVIVLSHGGYDELAGTNCSPSNDEEFKKARMKEDYDPIKYGRVNTHAFLRCFNSKEAPLLANKPKLFFFQACRGNDIDRGIHVPDTTSTNTSTYSNDKKPIEADFIVCHASAPNYISLRKPPSLGYNRDDDGSWFVYAICEVFGKFAAEEDLYSLLTRVNNLVAERDGKTKNGVNVKQIPEFSSRLTKKFYFFPGIESEGSTMDPGDTLKSPRGVYEIVKWIGSGLFGEVYLTNHKVKRDSNPEQVALKKIILHGMSEKRKEECKKEAELMKKTKSSTNQHIVKYLDSFIEKAYTGELFSYIAGIISPSYNSLFITMDYCSRGDLNSKIKANVSLGGHFDSKIIYDYIYQIADAINELHKYNIVHRDLKPANILIAWENDKEVLKISGFGLAKVTDSPNMSQSHSEVCDTPLYMAPEQHSGRYQSPVDIWAIGIIFYELCIAPKELTNEIKDLWKKVDNGQRVNLPSRYSESDTTWLNNMIAKDPNKRMNPNQVYVAARSKPF